MNKHAQYTHLFFQGRSPAYSILMGHISILW